MLLLKTQGIKNVLMFWLIKKITWLKLKIIQSELHKTGTYDVCKIYLTCFEDKRFILNYGINSLAYFHNDTASQ